MYIVTPTAYLRTTLADTFSDWFKYFETPPVYITHLEDVDKSMANIVLIDEVDVFLFEHPAKLHDLIQS